MKERYINPRFVEVVKLEELRSRYNEPEYVVFLGMSSAESVTVTFKDRAEAIAFKNSFVDAEGMIEG